MAKANIKFYPRLDKTSKKTGKTPIYLRGYNNGKKAECRLPIEMTKEEVSYWNEITQRCNLKETNINRFLNKYEKEFEDMKYSVGSKMDILSPNQILDQITGRSTRDNESILEYFNYIYTEVTLLDTDKTEGTKKNYFKALTHFNRFMEVEGKLGLQFLDVAPNFAESFWEYLITENQRFKKKKMSPVSARGYIKKMKTYFSYAIRKGKADRNPFDGLKMKCRSPRKEKLTAIQLKKIFTLSWTSNAKLERAIDLFRFCLLTGLSGGDALGLKPSDLQYYNEKDVFLVGTRKKTNQEYKQFLVSQALEIIKKYKLDVAVQSTRFLLPQISNQESNKWLKLIAIKVDVNFNLTTHSGRHGFRVMLNEAKILDHAVRKTMMGQSLNRDIDGVYNEVRENQLMEARNLYQTFLTNLFTKNEK